MIENTAQSLTLSAIGLFIIYICFREVNCWYWKINKRIEIAEETNRLLNILVQKEKDKEALHSHNAIADKAQKEDNVNNPEVLNTLLEHLKQKDGKQ